MRAAVYENTGQHRGKPRFLKTGKQAGKEGWKGKTPSNELEGTTYAVECKWGGQGSMSGNSWLWEKLEGTKIKGTGSTKGKLESFSRAPALPSAK